MSETTIDAVYDWDCPPPKAGQAVYFTSRGTVRRVKSQMHTCRRSRVWWKSKPRGPVRIVGVVVADTPKYGIATVRLS